MINDIDKALEKYGSSRSMVEMAIKIALMIADTDFKDEHEVVRAEKTSALITEGVYRLRALSRVEVKNLSLPEIAPVLYIPRHSGRASDFLNEHYRDYIESGVCFRPDIKRLDPKLEQALANEFRGRTDELRAILPTKADEVDGRIARELGGPVRPEDRQAAATLLSMTKKLKHRPM